MKRMKFKFPKNFKSTFAKEWEKIRNEPTAKKPAPPPPERPHK